MKRVFLLVILSFIFCTLAEVPTYAIALFNKKSNVENAQYKTAKIEKSQYEQIKSEQKKLEKIYQNEIRQLFEKHTYYSKKYDATSLAKLYNDNFVDNDGYSKEVYFTLVQDTWETYPGITYTTRIKNIELNGEYASVETEETAVAVADDLERKLKGELYSKAKCIYHLHRFANKWTITNENVLEEFSTLKYGDARFVDMHIEAPKIIGAGQEYNATLSVDLPPTSLVVASINQEKVIHPIKKSEDAIRRLNDNQTLTRTFNANTDNVNEYAVASVAYIAKPGSLDENDIENMQNGLAFIMVRVNVIPKNNFIEIDKTSKEKVDE